MNEFEKPFSSQWYAAPASRRRAKRVGRAMREWAVDVFTRRPSLHSMPVIALVLLVLTSPWIVHPRTILPVSTQVMSRGDLTLEAVPTTVPVRTRISTNTIGVQAGAEQGPVSAQSVQLQPAAALAEPTATQPVVEGSILPRNRVLLVYGLPGDAGFGMLGSYDDLRLLEILQDKCKEFEALDPDRPMVIGLQIIASAAQKKPGKDGSYLRDTSTATLYKYIEFTREHDMLLFLDVQIGRRTVPEDVKRLQTYLQQPHVHLAIDPEFAVGRTEIPTQDIGSTTAADIRWVQDYLVELAVEAGIPPKILIVHQIAEDVIVNRQLLRPVRGVQLVLNVSIWGSQDEKASAYQALIADDPVEFGGIMISSAWDSPAMTAEDVINLPSAPDIVIYQ